MSEIISVISREILDSRGNPTVEVEVTTADGNMGRAAVPSGASTGAHEACELRDGDKNRFLGKGVYKAVDNVREKIAPEIVGLQATEQVYIDKILRDIDGTENKSNLGANAILGVSLAVAKAAAKDCRLPLYRYVGGSQASRLPVPLMNVLNGGAHANNGLDIQEFMIVPTVNNSYAESLRAGTEIFHTLKKILAKKGLSTAVGDEGGFAPKLGSNQEALDLLMNAIVDAGYDPGQNVFLALDVAATEMFKEGKYEWQGGHISPTELLGIYKSWAEKYPLVSIEDGFAEDDWDSWVQSTAQMGSTMQLIGDDLFVTNPKRLRMGLEKKAGNALLVKVNQIGTLTETYEAVNLAQRNKFRTIMSHRSGETEDVTIADLAVGLNCHQIKTGSLCRGERTAKYNQLLRIEEDLGGMGLYWDKAAFR
ncbi:phosphopyruvate hydratase [Bdellovibrio bacteriovorus]|uniref:Enolase n=1 Tax=Bdellovibrio bacteriovorus (strain ATCC 15356 / DSM 50701 / NCIMB 9529 / HD100) TaxID=264462 RepID=ENO_BDEBA|nr:phosphopyruvate hydratase [Bdellovibrio bacteriovorus]Q6MPQ2.1 RecName: Full=Enolase; AltName: Full=2-phospho-D-glycerate hydro-lyase; AltName: Full=2-phosphoglycerate dehydratase [Bdellovibrio bacteriovorus HD100]CAE78745.1 phosphopyruvate hydratase [Bdellovibrio bacteriovorus HD100]